MVKREKFVNDASIGMATMLERIGQATGLTTEELLQGKMPTKREADRSAKAVNGAASATVQILERVMQVTGASAQEVLAGWLPYRADQEWEWIECGLCGMRSYNLDDIVNRYCGNCRMFLDREL